MKTIRQARLELDYPFCEAKVRVDGTVRVPRSMVKSLALKRGSSVWIVDCTRCDGCLMIVPAWNGKKKR